MSAVPSRPRPTARPIRHDASRPLKAALGCLLLAAGGGARAQSLSLLDARVVEGNTGNSALVFEARLSAPAAGRVSFNFDVADGSAVAGSDYQDVSYIGVLGIPAGATRLTVSVPVKSDLLVEPGEYVNASLSGVLGASVARASAKGLIVDDDNKQLVSGALDPATAGISAGRSSSASSSRDGRYVAFASNASDLVADGPTNGLSHLYVRDNRTGVTVLAVPAVGGGYADQDCSHPVLSGDGRYLVFESAATNLVANDNNGLSDVFRRDLLLGTTQLVSLSTTGGFGDNVSVNPSISADGRHVAFESLAGNLVAGDANLEFDVFVRDMQTGLTRLVSVKAPGSVAGYAAARAPSISADGRYIAFVGEALVPEDTWAYPDIYRRDMVAGATVRVSVASNGGNPSGTSWQPSISGDGRYVSFRSASNDLVSGIAIPSLMQVYRRDLQAGTTTMVSVTPAGTSSINDTADDPTMSADGRWVGFASRARASADDDDDLPDLFVRDLQAGTTYRLSKSWTGGSALDGELFNASMSGDGRFVAFLSSSSQMLPGDGNGQLDVFQVPMPVDASLPVLSVADVLVAETDAPGQASVVLSLSAASAQAVSVDLASADGSAQAGADYTALATTSVSFAPGQTQKTVTVTVAGDDVFEVDEAFNLFLGNPVGARLADAQAQVAIADDDAAPAVPALSIADASVAEGNAGTKLLNFTVSLSAPAAAPVVFDIATSDGSARAGSDYVALALASQAIPAGQSSKTIAITINGDTSTEIDETFTLAVTNVGGATVADGLAVGTISNDDAGPTLAINDVSVTEGDAGTSLATFTVTLSAARASAVSFDIATADLSAQAGKDYTARTTIGAVVPAGATSASFAVSVLGDTAGEANETFSVTLSNTLGAGVSDGVGIGTIVDDDAPELSIADVSVLEGQSGSQAVVFTVVLSDVAATPVTFDIASADGSANPFDYTPVNFPGLEIAAGQTRRDVIVQVKGDTDFEPDDTFTINLTNAAGAPVADGSATATIRNDDASSLPTLSIGDARVQEASVGGAAELVFPVTLSKPASTFVSFKLSTSDGSARASTDYTAQASATFIIPPGTGSTVARVPVHGDAVIEAHEFLFATLHDLVGAIAGDSSAIGQILNDDGPVLASAPDDPTKLVSDGRSTAARISPDGRFVVFESNSSNLVEAARRDFQDPFWYATYLRDTVLGTTRLVSEDPAGGRLRTESGYSSVSDDGRYVVFGTTASNMVPNDTNGSVDVFRRDMLTGTTELVSRASNGVDVANRGAGWPSTISGNGRYVAFLTSSTNVAPDSPNGGLMLRDMQTGVTTRISTHYDKTSVMHPGTDPVLSPDGRYVAYAARANQVEFDWDFCPPDEVCFRTYWRDLKTGETKMVSRLDDGTVDYHSLSFPTSISEDGRWVVFGSNTFDSNGWNDTFAADTRDNKLYLVSLGYKGQPGNGNSGGGSVSGDGSTFAFGSTADNMVWLDANPLGDVYVTRLDTVGNLAPIRSADNVGTRMPNGDTFTPSLSRDGRVFSFVSSASNLVPGDDNNEYDVFITGNPGIPSTDADLATLVTDVGALNPAFAPATTSYAFSVSAPSIRFTATPADVAASVTINGVATDAGAPSAPIALARGTNVVNIVVTAGDRVTRKTTKVVVTRVDPGQALLSIADVAIAEGTGGTRQAGFTVSLSAPLAGDVGFSLATADGSALAGVDYLPLQASGQVIPAGSTSKAFQVTLRSDADDENDEDFYVQLGAVTGAAVGHARARATILDDDAGNGPVLSISDEMITEDGGIPFAGSLRPFVATLSTAAAWPVTFEISTSDQSAVAGQDYGAVILRRLTIPAGETRLEFAIVVVPDTNDEANETFRVNLGSVKGASVASGYATATIIDDDGPGTGFLSIPDLALLEGNAGTQSASLTVSLAAPMEFPVSFDLVSEEWQGAGSGVDFVPMALTRLTIPAGATTKTVTVQVLGDTLPEWDEKFRIAIKNAVGAPVSKGLSEVTIMDDESPRAVQLGVYPARLLEGNNGAPLALFVARLSEPVAWPVTFDYATVDGTASAGSDYIARSQAGFTIPAGATTRTFAVQVLPDRDIEEEEHFVVEISNVVGADVDGGMTVGEIVNDDIAGSEVGMSVGDASIVEGNAGTSILVFPVDLGAPRTVASTFDVATSDDSATAPSDYQGVHLLRQQIPAGATHTTVEVPIHGDTLPEPDEVLRVTLSNPSLGLYIADDEAKGRIWDEEAGGLGTTPDLSIADATVLEGFNGTARLEFVVSLSAQSTQPASFEIEFANETATAGEDYVPPYPGRITFAPGETRKLVSVVVISDGRFEADETFQARVLRVTGAAVTDDVAIGMIIDDDSGPGPALSVSDATVAEGPAGSKTATFTVSLSAPSLTTVVFDVATLGGTATAGVDFASLSLPRQTIAPGQTSASFAVTIFGDTQVEANESFTLGVANVLHATLAKPQGRGVIANDDMATLSIADLSVQEGQAGTSTATFTLSLSQPMPTPVSFDIATADGSASAGSDYVARAQPGRVLDAGRTRASFEVAVNGDALVESAETFSVLVSNVVGALLGDGTATGTIQNDDSASLTTIATIQGSGDRSPLAGRTLATEGVVTARVDDGFFIQSLAGREDGDAASSDGLRIVGQAQAVALGDHARVAGEVRECAQPGDRASQTCLLADGVTVLGHGLPLPAPVALDADNAGPARGFAGLERLEGMRVAAARLTVIAPSGGEIDAASGEVRGNGRFHAVVAGLPRPFLEPGAHVLDPEPVRDAGPRFDGNPERLAIDSTAQPGAAPISADVGDVLSGMVGVLAQADATYQLLPDPDAPLRITAGARPRPVRQAAATEASIGSLALRRLPDAASQAGEPALRADAYALRLAKTANVICAFAGSPDILGLADLENADVLHDLAAATGSQAGNVLFPDACSRRSGYVAQAGAGQPTGLRLGFLVDTAPVRPGVPRVEVVAVHPLAAAERFPRGEASAGPLFEQAPLLLEARINSADGARLDLDVLLARLAEGAEHGDASPGGTAERQRARRAAQAEALARAIQERRRAFPSRHLVVLGDFEASEFSDGGADLVGTLAGTGNGPTAGLAPLVNLTTLTPAAERYTASRDGNAVALDHVLVSPSLMAPAWRARVEAARVNADFGEDNLPDPGVPVRVSDHDPLVLFLDLR